MERRYRNPWQRFWGIPNSVAVASVAAVMAGYLSYGVTVVLGAVGTEFGTTGTARPGSVAYYLGYSGAVLGTVLFLVRLGSVASVSLTRLADRRGRRPLLLATYVVGLLASLATAGAATLWMFVVFQIVARSGLTSANSLVSTIAAEEVEVHRRTRAVAAVAAAWGAGAGIAAAVYAGTKHTWLGWRGLYLGAMAGFVLLPFLRREMTETHRFAALGRPERRQLPVLLAPPYRRRLLVLCGVLLLLAVQATPAAGFALVFAEKVRGLASGRIAAIVLVAGLPGLGGLVASGWISDRIGRRVTAGAGILLAAGAAVGIYAGPRWAFGPAYWGLVTGGALATPAFGALTAELFPTSARATAAAIAGGVSIVGAALSLELFGVMVDALGGFGAAAGVLALGPCLGVAGMMAIPETKDHEMEEISPDVVPFMKAPL